MKEKIKIAYLGLGRRGLPMLKTCFSEMADVEIAVLCDVYQPALDAGAQMLAEKNYQPMPLLTTDYQAAISHPDVDAVVIMTGWREHAMLAERSMLAGKYTAIEVGCSFDLEECYRLIDIHEQTGSPLMMLENCCYGRREMMALNLHRQGLLGEVVHCAGGYHHYLCELGLLKNTEGEHRHYRLDSYIHRNCEQYPTHELGPIAKLLGINRGNRLLSLSSFASKARGIQEAAQRTLGEDHRLAHLNYNHGDIIDTIITCANGETIRLCLDTTLIRPYYSRNFTIRGTKGACLEERRAVYLQGMEEPVENNEEEMYEKYDHPLHREYHALGERAGHGGMDWLVCRAFIESVKNGTDTPIDAYDTVLWMSIAALSEMSIAQGGAPVSVPDFTKGRWTRRAPAPRGKYSLDEIVEDAETPIFP